jgi:hypothetical protein
MLSRMPVVMMKEQRSEGGEKLGKLWRGMERERERAGIGNDGDSWTSLEGDEDKKGMRMVLLVARSLLTEGAHEQTIRY